MRRAASVPEGPMRDGRGVSLGLGAGREYPAGTMRMWVGQSKHFLVFPVRAGQLLNYAGFVPSDTSVRESWSAPGDPAALAAHFTGWDPVIGAVIAAISGPGVRSSCEALATNRR